MTGKPTRQSSLRQAKLLQDFNFEVANQLMTDFRSSTSPAERRAIATSIKNVNFAWDSARESVRILRGIGAPKAVDGKSTANKRKQVKPSNLVAWEQQENTTPEPPRDEKQQGIS